MKLRAPLAAAVAALLCASAGCITSNADHCTNHDQCDTGYCDLAAGVCTEEPACECTNPMAPICDLGECRACSRGPEGDAECAAIGPEAPACVPEGFCAACVGDDDCQDPDRPLCSSDYECVACLNHDDCSSADAPYCSTSRDCRECLTSAHCEDLGASVCDGGSCRGCTADSECDSQICVEEEARCVSASATLVVDAEVGSDVSGCGSDDAPCETINGALTVMTPEHTHVRLRDGVHEGASFEPNEPVVVVGSRQAHISGGLGATPIDAGFDADVTLDGVTLVAGPGDDSRAVSCLFGRVELVDVEVRGDADVALAGNHCDVRVERSTVVGHPGIGVRLDDGSLVLRRSIIADNGAGGLDLRDSTFVIENNIFHANGTRASWDPDRGELSGGSAFGAIRLDPPASGDAILHFNTITGNNIDPLVVQPVGPQPPHVHGGVQCVGSGENVRARNNIVEDGQDGGPCEWRFGLFEGWLPNGLGNSQGEAQFVDVDDDDFHLAAGSPGIDEGDPSASVAVDFFGTTRPLGEGYDIGAIEFEPPSR